MSRLASSVKLLAGVTVLLPLAGCGNAPERQEITGTVNFQGRPVEDGVIRFEPVDGQSTGDGAHILHGKYRIVKAKGMHPGKYRVSIYAGDGRSGAGDASPDSPHERTKAGKEMIPAAYNEKSDVVREVTRDGPNQFDFDIP
jgi:hypothetical protein